VHADRGIHAHEAECGLEHRDDDNASADSKQTCQYAGEDAGRKHGHAENEPLLHGQALSRWKWKFRCSSMNVEMK
jgi:hypothetical protein